MAQDQIKITVPQALKRAYELHTEGQYKPAGALVQKVLQAQTGNAEAHHLFGVILQSAGRLEKGLPHIEEAVRLAPKQAGFRTNLIEFYRRAGRLQDAAAQGEEAIKLDPSDSSAHSNLGIVYYDLKDYARARVLQEKAIALNPDNLAALNNMGSINRDEHDREQALLYYRKVLERDPTYLETKSNLGAVLLEDEQVDEAEKVLGEVIAASPTYGEAYKNLGRCMIFREDYEKAEAAFKKAGEHGAVAHEVALGLAHLMFERSRYDEALAHARRALEIKPDHAPAHMQMASILTKLEDSDGAMLAYERALELDEKMASVYVARGNLHMELGNMGEARVDFDKALEGLKDPVTAQSSIIRLEKVTDREDPNLVALLKVVEEKESRDPRRYVPVHYAIGKAFEDLKLFDEAFEHFAKGAALKRSQISYDPDRVTARTDAIIAYFTRERIAALRAHASQDKSVIMVVGMPRSGTTLTETVIASHSRVHGGGERPELGRLFPPDTEGQDAYPSLLPTLTDARIADAALRYPALLAKTAQGAPIISDKMPANFQYIGLIHALLPNVKIVHTKRDPVDICVSLFTRLFDRSQYQSYDLVELGRYYRDYHRLMAHWRDVLPADAFYEFQYEELVSDFDTNARRLIAHVGLEWEEACATPHKTKRSVKTASVTQVREPVYTRSIRKWESYRAHLGPLLETLGDLVED